MRYLMGIDNGGTYCKAAIFDEHGRQISVASASIENMTPKPGYTERDMEDLWRKNAEAIRKAIQKSGIDPADIISVSFSGHGKGLYMLKEDGSPAYNGILSTDTRHGNMWKSGFRMVHTRKYSKVFPGDNSLPTCQLMAWFRDHRPDILKETRLFYPSRIISATGLPEGSMVNIRIFPDPTY